MDLGAEGVELVKILGRRMLALAPGVAAGVSGAGSSAGGPGSAHPPDD